MSKSISIDEFIAELKLVILNRDKIKNFRDIYFPSISRAGIELVTLKPALYLRKRIVVWSKTESTYLESIGIKKSEEAIKKTLSNKPPILILTKRFSLALVDKVVEIATPLQIPVIHTRDKSFSELVFILNPYLLNKFAPSTQLHASLVNINGIGVLLIGESGVGKSEAVLELLQKNHVFIADDAVIIKRVGKVFYGKPAPLIRDLLEIRGIGIIDIRLLFGANNIREESVIDIVVELIFSKEGDGAAERLGENFLNFELLGGYIPKIQIFVKEGRNLASLIEAARSYFIAKKENFSFVEKMAERRNELL